VAPVETKSGHRHPARLALSALAEDVTELI
jgi:hypothetical protein